MTGGAPVFHRSGQGPRSELSSAGVAPLRASLTSITTSERAAATRFLRCRLTALTFMADAGRLRFSVLLIRPHFLTDCPGRFTSGLFSEFMGP